MLIADRYEIDDLPMGRGGMGAVHHGLDTHLGRRVAVKFLHLPGGSDEQRERFVREARILARLEHPGAPILYDLGMHEQRLFQVMQFVDGVTVADVVAEHGPLPPAWVAAIGAQAAAVLAAAHGLEIVHRDLTPSNLMLRPDGSVVVLDFGLAVLAGAVRFTRMGQIFGSPSYMAPEQVQHGMADARSDLYALGCVLHELLTGVQLFAGQTAYAIFERQVREAPGPLPGAPPALARVVLDLLAKDPADRPADAAVLHDRLAPLAVDLPPLPGFLAPDPGPGRRYACVWGRTA
ncbi:serine/threonine protein kinase [Pseudonocardia sp. DSM 110487]|uniref:serine/threonine-protein kinase n=1 Tax=Pseudonocardia sp. DSM 110487 TaxID=2865833 RepID=UPI001C6A4573|nr:serine/threonine-protein kinase [Pseudonocardia sp. DSM 110487]QYN37272.1 serine/threonine protein kinase [Pseudonocardia sp. DSM 110487]